MNIEDLPEDMTWNELKELGLDYGPSLTFSRTYQERGRYFGMLEFRDKRDADLVVKELDNRRVQGAPLRLKARLVD